MIGMQTFIRRKTFLTVSACIFVGFAAPHALAGFEWIPQKKAPVADVVVVQPEPAAQLPSDDIILPLPSEAELQDPVIVVPEPVKAATEAVTPIPTPEPAAPTRISVMPKEAPNSGVLNTASKPEMLPPISEQAPNNDHAMLKKPPFEMTKTRIIVPDDAPANAVEQVEKKNAVIVPFPSEASLEATKDQPLTFTSDQPATQALTPLENAVGFAEDVPLALALRQVVPADFAYSFGQNVNPGLRVSWNGGKPWNEVVADMVTSLGYAVVISQKTVLIVAENSAMAPAPLNGQAAMSLEPAAGDADTTEASRERKIKRINIVDPGSENEETGLVEKVTRIFEPSEKNAPIEVALAESDADQNVATDTPSKISFWTAEAGTSLKETLAQWSQNAGTELVWDATHDFQLTSDFEVQGDFEKAVDLLLKHGIGAKNTALNYSYVATSGNGKTQIIIADKA